MDVYKYESRKSRISRWCCGFMLVLSGIILIALPVIKVLRKSKTAENEDETQSFTMTTINSIDLTQISQQITDQNLITNINNNSETTLINNLTSYWMNDFLLIRQRSYHEAVLLADKKVMVCGGYINSTFVTLACELYLSSTGWTPGSQMRTIRYDYTLTPFANNTKVLAAGTAYSPYQQTAEIYNSEDSTWKSTSTNMSTTRRSHAAALLKNEQILIIGGRNSSGSVISSVDLYIPSSNSFIKTNNLNVGRISFTSTLLNDGLTVLVTGGADINNNMIGTAELYISGSWILTNSNMTQPRAYHAAVLLNDRNVLIAGGGNGVSGSYSTAEIYNPTTRIFASVESMKYGRGLFTLTLLPSGKVLATGGIDWKTQTYSVISELYDPITQTWSNTRILNNGRYGHRSISLNDSVLTMGGENGGYNKLSSCEKYYF